MIFQENRLLADGSLEISYLIFSKNRKKCCKNFSSAAVLIGALRVNECSVLYLQHADITKQHSAEKKLVEEKEQIIKVCTVTVLKFRTLVACQKGIDKQCRPRSDCFLRAQW